MWEVSRASIELARQTAQPTSLQGTAALQFCAAGLVSYGAAWQEQHGGPSWAGSGQLRQGLKDRRARLLDWALGGRAQQHRCPRCQRRRVLGGLGMTPEETSRGLGWGWLLSALSVT